MSFTPEELEERIRVVEAELSWLKQGRAFIGRPTNAPNASPTGKMTELFPDERHLPNGTRPTLRQSIIIAMRERPMDDWRNDEIIAALGAREWLPGGKNSYHSVRGKLAEMAREGHLVHVDRGTYRLPREDEQP